MRRGLTKVRQRPVPKFTEVPVGLGNVDAFIGKALLDGPRQYAAAEDLEIHSPPTPARKSRLTRSSAFCAHTSEASSRSSPTHDPRIEHILPHCARRSRRTRVGTVQRWT